MSSVAPCLLSLMKGLNPECYIETYMNSVYPFVSDNMQLTDSVFYIIRRIMFTTFASRFFSLQTTCLFKFRFLGHLMLNHESVKLYVPEGAIHVV